MVKVTVGKAEDPWCEIELTEEDVEETREKETCFWAFVDVNVLLISHADPRGAWANFLFPPSLILSSSSTFDLFWDQLF